jgi:hypothetical protein
MEYGTNIEGEIIMDNAIEQAAKVIRDLEDELEALTSRKALLDEKRQKIAYAARTGDKKAKSELTSNNAETISLINDVEIITDALVEARKRLGDAEQLAALQADQAKAVRIKELQAAFIERLEIMHKACEDFALAAKDNKVLLSEMHRLGVTAPSHDIVRIQSVTAIKTMLNALPWHKEFQFELPPSVIAPGDRTYFKNLAHHWGLAIENQIRDRLPKQDEAA